MMPHRKLPRRPAGGRRRWPAALLLALLVATGTAGGAGAIEGISKSEPIVFTADEVIYDEANKTVTAKGRVEAHQAGRTVVAEEVRYDEPNNRVTARGQVTLFEPTGEVLFGDDMELTGDLKEGVIENFRMILADGARLAGSGGRRIAGNRTELDRAVYSACDVCATDPDRPLLWQVKAVRVTHDQDKKIIEFDEATIEIADIPVLYLPYFYTPDPTVKRKTGFLLPVFGASSDLGGFVQIPYFWAISEHQDLTVTPWLMTGEEGYALLEGEYRQRFTHGSTRTLGMITRDGDDKTRGYINSRFRYDLNETWRAGFNAERANNSGFIQKYTDINDRTLTSRVFAEAFEQRDYFSANAYAFQGLETNDQQDVIPWVAPKLNYYLTTTPDRLGGITTLGLDGTVLTRDDGTDTRRLSMRGQWQAPFMGPLGDIYTVSGSLWADGYNVDNLPLSSVNDREFDGNRGRVFPQGGISWRMPFVRDGETISQVIEPTVEFVAAPNYGNPSRIPDEDSTDFSFEDTNVFGLSRQPGLDRVEKGNRVNYGVGWTGYGPTNTAASVFVGQVYRFRDDNSFPDRSGLDGNLSDYVTAIRLSPGAYVDLSYRARHDKDSLTPRSQEVGVSSGVDAVNANVYYVRYQGQPNQDLDFREEISFGLRNKLTRYWRTYIYGTHDLDNGGTWRSIGIRGTYEDECFIFSAEFRRRNIDARDVESSNTFFLRVGLKTVGSIGSGFKP